MLFILFEKRTTKPQKELRLSGQYHSEHCVKSRESSLPCQKMQGPQSSKEAQEDQAENSCWRHHGHHTYRSG